MPNKNTLENFTFGGPTTQTIANAIFYRFNQNEDNVQEKAKASPEPYRCIMYTLYPPAADIDGTDVYWDIVDALEALMCD